MTLKMSRYLTCLLILFILAACTPGDIRQGTPTPEITSTEATTPIPTERPQNTGHTWQAQPALITMQGSPGYTDENFAWALGPDLIVYADGTIIYSTWSDTGNYYGPTYWSAQVSTQELCNLLIEIEENGFFELSPDDYTEPGITDMGNTHIDIYGWRSKSFSAYALSYAVSADAETYGEAAPEALKETYLRLGTYRPANAVRYEPERVSLLVGRFDYDVAAEFWPLSDPDLAELAADLDLYESDEFVFEGETAANIWELFNNSMTKFFEVDGLLFDVTIRPLFPHEIYSRTTGWGRLSHFESTPTTKMTCGNELTAVPTTEPAQPIVPSPTASTEETARGPVSLQAPLEYIFWLGRRDDPGQMESSSAIIGTPQGDLLVSDPGNDRFQHFALDGTFLETIPLIDSSPQSMAFAPNGNLLIANWWKNTVEVRSPNGEELLQSYSDWPPPDDGYNNPTDNIDLIAAGPENQIYTGERNGNRVIILNPDGTFLEEWRGSQDNPLENIQDIGTDSAGNLYVISSAQDRIVRRLTDGTIEAFSFPSGKHLAVRPDGSFFAANEQTITRFDSNGQQITSWTNPNISIRDLATATDGSVVIQGGSTFDEIEPVFYRYDEDGNELSTFGSSLLQPGQFAGHITFSVSALGDTWIMAFDDMQTTLQLVHIDPDDNHLNTFTRIADQPFSCNDYSLVALSDQSVIVGDSCEGTIIQVNAEGEIIAQWGARGTNPGQINLLADLVLAPDGESLYLADTGNGRISQFTFDGQLLDSWESDVLDTREPTALTVASDGTFFMIDGATGEVIVRPSQGESIRWTLPIANENPNDIALDEKRQRIYVGGSATSLYVFDWTGSYLGRTQIFGSSGVLVNVWPEGYVYASTGYEEINVYQPTE